MKAKIITAVVLVILLVACILCACNKDEKYNVDYCGSKEMYDKAKDSYRAGEKVTLYFKYIATDTDYSFYLDGERLNVDYDERKGFIISFTMPDHDVKLEYNSKNSMVYIPEAY